MEKSRNKKKAAKKGDVCLSLLVPGLVIASKLDKFPPRIIENHGVLKNNIVDEVFILKTRFHA